MNKSMYALPFDSYLTCITVREDIVRDAKDEDDNLLYSQRLAAQLLHNETLSVKSAARASGRHLPEMHISAFLYTEAPSKSCARHSDGCGGAERGVAVAKPRYLIKILTIILNTRTAVRGQVSERVEWRNEGARVIGYYVVKGCIRGRVAGLESN